MRHLVTDRITIFIYLMISYTTKQMGSSSIFVSVLEDLSFQLECQRQLEVTD